MTNGKRGAPEGNDNAVTHGLYQSHENLRANLTDREEQMLVDIATDLLDRFPEDAEIGAYERASIEQISLDVIKRFRANQYILEEDMAADGSELANTQNQIYSRILRDTTNELEKLGLLREGPEMRKAEASESWMEAIGEATTRTDADE